MEYRWRVGRLWLPAPFHSDKYLSLDNNNATAALAQQQRLLSVCCCWYCCSRPMCCCGIGTTTAAAAAVSQPFHCDDRETGNRFTLPPASPPPCSSLIKLRKINSIPHETWIEIMPLCNKKRRGEARGEAWWGGLVERLHSWHFALLAFLTFLGSG